jgi:hypothetical protein
MPVPSQENDKNTFHMTLEGRFSHGGNVKTFVAAFPVCFMNIWAISKPGMVLWLL